MREVEESVGKTKQKKKRKTKTRAAPPEKIPSAAVEREKKGCRKWNSVNTRLKTEKGKQTEKKTAGSGKLTALNLVGMPDGESYQR